MELTADEHRIVQAFADRISAGFPHSVIWLNDLSAMTGLDDFALELAVDRLTERGWLICAGNEGWHARDFCALVGAGSDRAMQLAGRVPRHAAAN